MVNVKEKCGMKSKLDFFLQIAIPINKQYVLMP